MMSIKRLYPIAFAAILACSTASGTSGTTTPLSTTPLLTAQEIVASHAFLNAAYDAVARLRPNWLAHGPIVFVNGQESGGIEALKSIPASQVIDIRYYDMTQAGGRFGLKAGGGGALEVRTK